MKKLLLSVLLALPVIGFSQTLSIQNTNTIKNQGTSQLRSYNMFQAIIDSLHLISGGLHQGTNILTQNLTFDGAYNVRWGDTSIPLGIFDVVAGNSGYTQFSKLLANINVLQLTHVDPSLTTSAETLLDATGVHIAGGSGGLSGVHITKLDLTGTSALFTDTRTSLKGLEYAATGYVTQLHSLVDKQYADALVGGSPLSFSNGLTNTAGVVKLGGALTQNTSIDGNFNLGLGASSALSNLRVRVSTISFTPESQLSMDPGIIVIQNSFTSGNQYRLQVDGSNPGFGGSNITMHGGTGNYLTFGDDASPTGSGPRGLNVYIGTSYPGSLRLSISEAGVWTANFGSDATGDTYYRNSSGNLVRRGIGSTGNVLTVSGGLPTWGSVSLTSGVTGILPLANGGTASNLTDPGANTLLGWDDTDNTVQFLTIGSGLTYTHATHTLSASGGGGGWLLTGTSTLTGVATITSNAKNQHIFNGTWTATAAADAHIQFGGTLTAASGLGVTGYLINPSLAAVGTSSVQIGLDVAPTFSGGTTPVNIAARFQNGGVIIGNFSAFPVPTIPDALLIRTDQNAATRLAIINNTSGTAASSTIVLSNSAALSTGITLAAISAGFSSSNLFVANTAVLGSSLSGGLNIGTQVNSPIQFWVNNSAAGAVVRNSFGAGISHWTFGSSGTAQTAIVNITSIGLSTVLGVPTLLVANGAHTNLTASTEVLNINLNTSATVQYATGAQAILRNVLVQAPTIGFVGASVATDVATFTITGPPKAGTNATHTNSHGLLIQAGAVTSAGAAFGLTSNAPTGGTLNYAGQGIGGSWLFAAGTTTYAPIIIPSGTNLTTTKAGALENDGTHLYFTFANSGTRYQLDQQSGGSGITVGTTTITSGTSTRIPFNDGGVYNEDAGLTYDKTNDAITVGVSGIRLHSSGSATTNIFIGNSTGNFTGTGASNVIVGANGLQSYTSGTLNSAIGRDALSAVTSGSRNTGIGNNALHTVATADGNTGIGQSALNLATAANNTGIGYGAGSNITSGTNNFLSKI